jgi:hypothetical protein
MALLLIAFLYLLAGAVLWAIGRIPLSNELGLFVSVVAAVGALVGPIAVYSFIDRKLTLRAAIRVGSQWCHDHGVEFLRAEWHKNHFAAIYNKNNRQLRAKFRVHFVPTTWSVKRVEWLKDVA